MRKVTQNVCNAFEYRRKYKEGNSHTDGDTLYLHGNPIAEWRGQELYISSCGWETNTTKERLNGLQGVSIHQKDYIWYLNGVKWEDSHIMTQVSAHKEEIAPQEVIAEDSERVYTVATT